METLYRRVYINGKEENLPKEEGKYLIAFNRNYIGISDDGLRYHKFCFNPKLYSTGINEWLEHVDWYLLPLPETQGAEGIKLFLELNHIREDTPITGKTCINLIQMYLHDFAQQIVSREKIIEVIDNYRFKMINRDLAKQLADEIIGGK